MTERAASRRAEYSGATRQALVGSAQALFAERGYAGTSLDEVVGNARVTKGALYHHYQGKQALFEATFEELEKRCVATITTAVETEQDPWQRALAGLRAFLAQCREPTYRRIVMQEGPVVLGFERWREIEERSTYGLVRGIVASLLEDQSVEPTLVETFTQVFYGALRSAGLAVADASDPERASAEVETVIVAVLEGLRNLKPTL